MNKIQITITGTIEGKYVDLLYPNTMFNTPFYQCMVRLGSIDTKTILPLLEAAKAETEENPKSKKSFYPWGLNSDGTLSLTLKSNAYKILNKKKVNCQLPMVDVNNEPICEGCPELLPGDIIQVDLTIKPWQYRSFGHGVKLQMDMVKVVKRDTGEPEEEYPL